MQKLIGVGFLLFISRNILEELFTIKELKDKPQYSRFKGMKSFPLETFREEDGSAENTIRRAMREEIGVTSAEVPIFHMAEEVFHPIPGREDIDILYGYGMFIGNPDRLFVPEDDDIEIAGWKTIPELLRQYKRVEVEPILEHFQKEYFQKLFANLN